jgi:Tol biopolymer transport system component
MTSSKPILLALVAVALMAQEHRTVIPVAGQSTGRRVALVIGNQRYSRQPLANPMNDATDLASALEPAGFQVMVKTNLGKEAMDEALIEFTNQLKPGDTGLFYFSGHAMEISGQNYLLPVDFNAQAEFQVRTRSLNANEVLEGLRSRGVTTSIMILDACRNNPYRGWRSEGGGLAAIQAEGAYVAFAAAPGQVASDNPGQRNGLFTKHLKEVIAQPGLSIDDVFNEVRQRVYAESSNGQRPYSTTGLIGRFYFRLPGRETRSEVSPPAPAVVPPPAEARPIAVPANLQVRGGASVSFQGEMVLFTGGASPSSRQIYVVPLRGGAPSRQITSGQGSSWDGRWSPDSQSILFLSDRSGSAQLWSMRADGSHASQLTHAAAAVERFAPSPDGKRVVYATADAGASIFRLFRVSLPSGADVTELASGRSPAGTSRPDFSISPDSVEVCFGSYRDGSPNRDLHVVPLVGGPSRRITNSPKEDAQPAYSPDGKYLAYRSAAGDTESWAGLNVLDRSTGRVTNVTQSLAVNVREFIWSPDAQRLFYLIETDRGSQIMVVPTGGGAARTAISSANSLGGLEFSLDGRALLYTESLGLWVGFSTGGSPVKLAP